MNRPRFSRWSAKSLLLTVMVGAACYAALASTAFSPEHADRAALLSARLERTETRAATLPNTRASAIGAALCRGELSAEARTLRDRLSGVARAAKLEATSEVQSTLQPTHARIDFAWTGSGDYTAVVSALSSLEAQRPTIFVRTMALRPQDGGVVFSIEGSVLCFRSRR